MPTLIILLGAVDGGEALQDTLRAAGLEPRPAPTDTREILAEQLRAESPLDAYTWSRVSFGPRSTATVVRLLAGAEGGLDPSLPQALSGTSHGLVLAMEATRTRDRYLLGSFLSGRAVEAAGSAGGVAWGTPTLRLNDEDGLVATFIEWLDEATGAETPPLPTLGADAEGAIWAPPWPGWSADRAAPATLLRTAVRDRDGNVTVDERAGPPPPRPAEPHAGAAAATILLGAAAIRWSLVDADGARTGVAHGHRELTAAVPAWAVAAPGPRDATVTDRPDTAEAP